MPRRLVIMAHCLPSKRAHAKRIDAAVKFGLI